ncbi:MAG: carbohydrate ABC transporter permease [Candidatus Dormibacteraceae bacterium]
MTRSRTSTVLSSVAVLAFLLWVLIPILIIFQNSLKPTLLIFTSPPTWTFQPTLAHYVHILSELHFQQFLTNSTIVAISSSVLALVLGSPAAYALARLRLRGRSGLAFLILLSRMVPAFVLVVPMFTIFVALHGINTYWAIVAAHTSFTLPIVIWMMRSFFEDVPVELEEAARVDGATQFGAFVRVALPLSAPGLVASGILCLLFSWNEFLFALILSGQDTQTMPIGVSGFIGTVSVDWGGSSAAAVLAMIPVFILGLAVQRFLVRGLTLGAVKG